MSCDWCYNEPMMWRTWVKTTLVTKMKDRTVGKKLKNKVTSHHTKMTKSDNPSSPIGTVVM